MTMTAPPISVSVDGGQAIENNDFFDVDPNGAFGFDENPSALSYMSGTAAAALGLTQASGAINSSPGGQHPTVAQFMNNLVQNENGQFGSFQSDESRLNQDLAAWAQSTDGYQFVTTNLTTSRAGSSAPTTDPAGTYSGPAERARPRRRRRGLIYRSPGRPLLRRKSSTPPATTASRGRAHPLRRSPAIMSRPPAPAARRRFLLAITNRTMAQRRSSWRCRQPYRAQSRGSLLRLGSLTRRFLPSRSPIQTSVLQTVFRSSSGAGAAHWPTARVSTGSRKTRPAFISFRGPTPRSPANSTRLFLLRTRSARRRRLLWSTRPA